MIPTTAAPTAAAQALTYQRRLERLLATLRTHHLDALLITNPENRRYISGFTGHDSGADSAGALVVTDGQVSLITDGRYTEQAEQECPGVRIVKRDGDSAPLTAQVLVELGAQRVGFEAMHLTVSLRDDLELALAEKAAADNHPELLATRRMVEPLRAVKDDSEIAAIERAVAITDETFAHLCGYLQPGMQERQVAHEIVRFMQEKGAEGVAFEPHVASGPNAALPHATPSERKLALGEPVIIDMGARFDGYCSDMTRTICLGEPGPEAQAIYDAVLTAQQVCERGLQPGHNGREADALARDSLTAAGYGDQFLHSLGHGLGLEIHEDPRLRKLGEEHVLTPGMVVTIEPGVYIAGWGGVRIEDTVVVTEGGIRVLTTAPKRFSLPH
jgi:Xaa-Pro aminopeptidase